MTQRDERYRNPSREHSDPALADAVADLDRAYIIAPPPHLREAMDKPGMNSRYVQVGPQVYAYNPEMRGDNTIMLAPEARAHPSWLVPNDVFDAAGVTQELSTLATQSPQRVQLLPQQTLDGHTVAVIEVDGWTDRPAQRTTFYFDAQSYVLRGFDAVSRDPSYPTPSWQVRLSSYATMPAAAVPLRTFTLN